jgi:hypothetical protein
VFAGNIEGSLFGRTWALRNRKDERYQIINRFKKFESCLNRLYMQKLAGGQGLTDLLRPSHSRRMQGRLWAVAEPRHILYLICPAKPFFKERRDTRS